MSLMHNHPDRKWTVADLATEVAVSPSVLDERFRRMLGRSPIRYLTDWRIHVADKNTKLNLAIAAGAVVVFAGSLWLVRSQTTVQDTSYMRAMIPHHSIAILTSERAELNDVGSLRAGRRHHRSATA